MREEDKRELDVFTHMLYELDKGIRELSLLTTAVANREVIKKRLDKTGYNYLIEQINDKFINVFFGENNAVNVVKSFEKKSLNKYSDEQDFILGILLGYRTDKQCERYLKRKTVIKEVVAS